MKVKFWGVRGSIPTPIFDKTFKTQLRLILSDITTDDISTPEKKNEFIENLTFDKTIIGGNTACVELQIDNKLFIFDMGSGIIQLGNYLVRKQRKNGLDINIFISHTHWDHILGLPFFKPAFYSNNKITFFSPITNLEKRLILQQNPKYFPISLDLYPASTDSEHKHFQNEQNGKFIDFFKDADILIFDAQYTLEEAIDKRDWGHSTALTGIDLAIRSNVKKLVLFHHEPDNNDEMIHKILKQSIKYRQEKYPNSSLEVSLAYEGMEINL
jgi:ribonuclease BN (tRNA processing enzyme)